MKIRKFIFTIFMCLLLNSNIFGVIFGNDSCYAFIPGCLPPPGDINNGKPVLVMQVNASLDQLIVDGAGYYLASQSAFLGILQKVELAKSTGIDILYTEVLKNISLSESVYYDLVNAVKPLEYNQFVLGKLCAFDYEGFANKKDLNPSVFATVAKYLSNGDVKGVYDKFFNDTSDIHNLILGLKLIPGMETNELESLWRINQKFSDTLLFGQYITEVFKAIK